MKNFSLKITVLLGCLWLASIPSLADQFTHKGFYIGLGVNFDDISVHKSKNEEGCDGDDCKKTENIGFSTTLSPRIGYQFDESRLEYMWMHFNYRYQSQPFHASWHLINFDYNIFRGIVLGMGSGLVTGKHGGLILRVHFGYIHPIKQDMDVSIHYAVQTSIPLFSFLKSETISVGKSGLEVAISYHF